MDNIYIACTMLRWNSVPAAVMAQPPSGAWRMTPFAPALYECACVAKIFSHEMWQKQLQPLKVMVRGAVSQLIAVNSFPCISGSGIFWCCWSLILCKMARSTTSEAAEPTLMAADAVAKDAGHEFNITLQVYHLFLICIV